MEITQEKLELIENIVKNDRKFVGNEDLYEDFFNEMCKRSVPIVNTITSDVTLKAYLRKIATTSILNVLKDTGRLKRTGHGFEASGEILAGNFEQEKDDNSTFNYSEVEIVYPSVAFEDSPEDIALQKEIFRSVVDAVYTIDKEEPDEQFLRIYKLRYDGGMTQQEIGNELGISQSEVSKRLFKLMQKVRQTFN